METKGFTRIPSKILPAAVSYNAFNTLPCAAFSPISFPFPKIYYQMEKGLLHIRCEITLGKYQDQLLRLEDKLESGLYCELTDKTLHDGYIEYTLLYDMIANRITIDEVRAENGCLRLMKNLVWEYDALPHALIAGGTGGGKTYFLLTLIEALLHTNAVLYILDPKNSDLADLGTVMPNVYHTKEEMIDSPTQMYHAGDPIGYADLSSSYWQQHLIGAGRVKQ